MAQYKVILADDHTMFREGLKSLIDQEPSLKVVGQAKDGKQLIQELESLKCGLVVPDLSMPRMDGMTAIKEVRRRFPKIKILVLTMRKDYEHFKRPYG